MCPAQVVGPHTVEKTEWCIIGKSKCFCFFCELGNCQDWSKQFLLNRRLLESTSVTTVGCMKAPSPSTVSLHRQQQFHLVQVLPRAYVEHQHGDPCARGFQFDTFAHTWANLPLCNFSNDSIDQIRHERLRGR